MKWSFRSLSRKNKPIAWGMLCALLLLGSCQNKAQQEAEKGRALARVDKQTLWEADLSGVLPVGTNAKDSAEIVNRFVESWLRRQLLFQHAQTHIEYNRSELEQKVQDYRYALLTYEFEKKYLEEKLQREVSKQEIESYYQNHQSEFELKQNIVRALYVKIPLAAPQQESVRRWIQSGSENDRKQLANYCFSNALDFSMQDSIWVDFDALIKGSPLERIPDKVNLLKYNRFIEAKDEENQYFMYILNYKIVNQISPLEFVEQRIKDMVINQRKTELMRQFENELYQKAQKDKKIEIYR